jgi:hypothetical protein
MARSKPSKPKSPHKQQIEEQNNKDKTETTPHITPQTSKPSKTTTIVEARSNKSNTPREAYIRNPENIPYYDGDTLDRRIYRRDRNNHQLNEDGEPINSTGDEFMQPSDEDAQGNVLPDEEIEIKRVDAAQKTPNKEDSKPAAQSEAEESPLSVEQPRNRLRKQHHESETMKQLFTNLARDNQKQFKEHEEKHTMEIVALKIANMDTHNLLTTKTTPAQTMSDHRSTAHFNTMTKPSDTLFDGTPENWPAFEHHLLIEAKNPTISWNHDITNYQPNKNSEPFNFLEIYFYLPYDMTTTLMNDLAEAKQIDLVQPSSQLFKLHCLKKNLKTVSLPTSHMILMHQCHLV